MSTTRLPSVLPPARRQPGPLRHIVESFVLLALAVVLFRGFAAEGYLISTGSMAPTLLGHHHRILCPECGFLFARAAYPTTTDTESGTAWASHRFRELDVTSTQCPNCGLSGIASEAVPKTDGDQLLVQKHAYEFRSPRRWEVIVFRNPEDPRQAYVKRVVGMPGETIAIRDGDLFADNQICRKPFVTQHAMRIPVSRYTGQEDVDDPDWRPSWTASEPDSHWALQPEELRFAADPAERDRFTDWVEYRHWIRAGGDHLTSVPLAEWPPGLSLPQASYDHIEYRDGRLQCRGALMEIERRNWLSRSDVAKFQQAINDLFVQSHISPVNDTYGYNPAGSSGNHAVTDLMLSATLEDLAGEGRFEMELTDGETVFRAVISLLDHKIELLQDAHPVPIRTVELDPQALAEPLTIDLSLFDGQAILAVNEVAVDAPVPFRKTPAAGAVRRPARIGAAAISCRVTDLTLYRDVYYTEGPNGIRTEAELGDREFFVLGDNSPVSVDSRVWPEPAVHQRALIGKPLVVHLPSRSSAISWGGEVRYFRTPDFSRARVIH